MDDDKAKVLLKYAHSSSFDNSIKGLREIKKRLIISPSNLSVFKKLGISSILISLLGSSNEEILLGTLSILSIILADEDLRKEVYLSACGLQHLLNILSSDKQECVKWRSCRAIGIQCLNGASCKFFHEQEAVSLILDFMKKSKSSQSQESAIKTLRFLGNSKENCKLIFKQKAIFGICENGINASSLDLSKVSLKTLIHFMQLNHPSFYKQVMDGTSNFKSLVEVYYRNDQDLCDNILDVFINTTLFSIRSGCQNESLCIKLVEALCYERVLLLMTSNLKVKLQSGKSYSRLAFAFCGLCEKSSNWKFTLQQVLHEKFWYQLTECEGIRLIILLLEKHKEDISLLLPILRALLGVEIIHSLRVLVLKTYLTSRLLPLLKEILGTCLNKIDCSSSIKNHQCRHTPLNSSSKRKSPSYSQSRRKIKSYSFFEYIENDSCESSPNSQGGDFENSIQKHQSMLKEFPEDSSDSNTSRSFDNSCNLSLRSSSCDSLSSHSFESVGSLSRSDSSCAGSSSFFPDKMSFSVGSPSICSDSSELQISLSNGNNPDASCGNNVMASEVNPSNVSPKSSTNKFENSDAGFWMTIIDCILRLLHQIITVKGDITLICKEFFPLVYTYMSKSQVVHISAITVINEIAKNSSCIKPLLDTRLIPSLSVELRSMTASKDCQQCKAVNKGITQFFAVLGQFFTHSHHYGRCEISDRLQPSRDPQVKNNCLLALPHIIKCPRLLNSLLQQDTGIQDILNILKSSVTDASLNLLSTSAVSILISNLKIEYALKKQNLCVFCSSNFNSIYGDSKFTREEKHQLLQLTKLNSPTPGSESNNPCLLDCSPNKNLSLKCGSDIIQANREFLAEKNEVFKAMLSGHFSESALTEVEIKDMDAQCLKMVIHFLYGCTCHVFQDADLNCYLQLIFISQMYFMPNLGILATHYLCSLILAEDVLCVLEKTLPMLEDRILQHLICSLVSKDFDLLCQDEQSRSMWLLDILNSPFKDQFLEHLQLGLLEVLKLTSVLCSCDMFGFKQLEIKGKSSQSYEWAYC